VRAGQLRDLLVERGQLIVVKAREVNVSLLACSTMAHNTTLAAATLEDVPSALVEARSR
jgi:hypothetical protein